MSQTLALLHSAEGFVFVAAASVRPHHPLVIPGDYLLDLLVAVPGPHLVDRGLVRIEGHQVDLLPTYLPASIVGVDHRRVPNPSPVSSSSTRGTLRTGIPTWWCRAWAVAIARSPNRWAVAPCWSEARSGCSPRTLRPQPVQR